MPEETKIYFDSNATTPLSEKSLAETIKALRYTYGNPSSVTSSGRQAKNLLSQGKQKIATLLGCEKEEIIFTSGGTESVHSIIHGICSKRHGPILTTAIEHKCVLDSIGSLNQKIEYLGVNEHALPNIEKINECLKKSNVNAVILSIVNGEIGSILPYKEIAEICMQYHVPLILDGVAALGKIPLAIYPGMTAIAFSGHKCHGPKGTGFFYLNKDTPFTPMLQGGHQEYNKRAGTENVPGIIGLCAAVSEISQKRFDYLETLRNYFEQKITYTFPNAIINGGKNRVTNVSNISFDDIDGDHLLIFLDQNGVTASLGSACSSGTLEPSHVLIGIGKTQRDALSSLRFSFNVMNSIDEIDAVTILLEKYKTKYILTP